MGGIGFDGLGLDGGRVAFAHGAIVFASLLVYVLVTRAGHHRRVPSAAAAWVLLIAMFPYLGLPLFLTFGTRKVVRPGRSPTALRGPGGEPREAASAPIAGPVWADDVLHAMQLPPAVANTAVAFDDDGERARQALLALIGSARRRLDVCTFILGDDPVGDGFVAALAAAAERGVQVRLLLDAFGSLRIAPRQRRRLEGAGVRIRRFMPLLRNPLRGRANLRNHRKLAIADGERLWSGGRNLAAEYFVARGTEPPWIDLSFTVTGPLAAQAAARFESDWLFAPGRRVRARSGDPRDGRPSPAADVPVADVPVADVPVADVPVAGEPAPDMPAVGMLAPVARFVPSGPDLPDDTVYALLLTAAYHARRRFIAVTPYFVPDDSLRFALAMAARRGIMVTLVVPARSNHPLADLARPDALRQLVQAGVSVLLHPMMIHAKAVVVDDDFALCGSVNLDGRSLFLNYESMVAFHGPAEVAWLADWLQARMRDSVPYVAERPSWSRDLLEGAVRAVAYQL